MVQASRSASRYPRRKPAPRLAADCYVGRRLAFLTICTAHPATNLTADATAAHVAFAMGDAAGRTGHLLETWVIMPDHLHVLTRGLTDTADVREWVRRFKSRTAIAYRRRVDRLLWQRGFFDRVLRREDALERVCRYILENPCRKQLCGDWRTWPWSGGPVYERLLQEDRMNRRTV